MNSDEEVTKTSLSPEIQAMVDEDWGLIAKAKDEDIETLISLSESDYTMMEVLGGIALLHPNESLGDKAIEALLRHRRSKIKDKRKIWPGYYDINILKYGGNRHGASEEDVNIRKRAIEILEKIGDVGMLMFIACDRGENWDGEGRGFTGEDKCFAYEATNRVLSQVCDVTVLSSGGVTDVVTIPSYKPPEIREKLLNVLKACPGLKEYWKEYWGDYYERRVGKFLEK